MRIPAIARAFKMKAADQNERVGIIDLEVNVLQGQAHVAGKRMALGVTTIAITCGVVEGSGRTEELVSAIEEEAPRSRHESGRRPARSFQSTDDVATG